MSTTAEDRQCSVGAGRRIGDFLLAKVRYVGEHDSIERDRTGLTSTNGLGELSIGLGRFTLFGNVRRPGDGLGHTYHRTVPRNRGPPASPGTFRGPRPGAFDELRHWILSA